MGRLIESAAAVYSQLSRREMIAGWLRNKPWKFCAMIGRSAATA